MVLQHSATIVLSISNSRNKENKKNAANIWKLAGGSEMCVVIFSRIAMRVPGKEGDWCFAISAFTW